ncbi:SRPBCC family protein [Desertibaculum subflavum]|uniref:SRPBCC family protein n=1 Tax=Desertibaculum subflavum TaxID=2268458 RepID=UPI000E66C605
MSASDLPGTRIVVECELDAAPEKVWRALTEPELLARWLAPNDFSAEPGARFRFRGLEGATIDCEVLEAEPPRKLSYRWRHREDDGIDSIVSFELTEAVAGRTHLRLVHAGFPLDLATPLTRMAQAGGRVVSLALALACRDVQLPRRRAA